MLQSLYGYIAAFTKIYGQAAVVEEHISNERFIISLMHWHDARLAKPEYGRAINPHAAPPSRQSDQPFVLIGQAKFLYDPAWQSQRSCECGIDNCRYCYKVQIYASNCDFNFRLPEDKRAIPSDLPDHPSDHGLYSSRARLLGKVGGNFVGSGLLGFLGRGLIGPTKEAVTG